MGTNHSIPYVDIHPNKKTAFIKVSQVSLQTAPPLEKEIPHRHNYQTIVWATAGHGKHIIDGQEIITPAHTLCLIARGQVHRFAEMSHDFAGYSVRFTDDFLANDFLNETWNYKATLFNNLSLNYPLIVPFNATFEFKNVISLLLVEYENKGQFSKDDILRYLLQYLLTKIENLRRASLAHQKNPVTLTDYEIYQTFITHLEAEFQAEHHVNSYASRLTLTSRQLSDITKGVVGKTAKQIIADRLMLEAKRYLQFTPLSIKEIAFSLGYESPFYFSQAFKNATGLSPSAYKKQPL
jgi:AraC-like DNA-binding protein/quercetin dioxygenase-like cupin family protein